MEIKTMINSTLKPHTDILGSNFRAVHLISGIFLVYSDRHSGLAVQKESVATVEYLKPLQNLDLSRFEYSNDVNHYFFESHINQSIIESLVPANVFQKIRGMNNIELAEIGCEKAKNIVKNHFPMFYEQMHGIQLSASESNSVSEAEFYQLHQNKYVITALSSDIEFGTKGKDNKVIVKFKARKLSEGEIYGSTCPTLETINIEMSSYEKFVKTHLELCEYPTNKKNQILLPANIYAQIEDFKMAS